MLDNVAGVPTHPLAVHAPVVLIPLLTIASIVVLIRRQWLSTAAVPMAVGAFAMAVGLFVSKQSGERLLTSEDVFLLGSADEISRHQDLGTQTGWISIAWFVIAAAAAVFHVLAKRNRAQPLSADAASTTTHDTAALALSVAAAVAASIVTIWVIRTGHAGAESRWGI